MLNFKIPVFIKCLLLFTLTTLACAVTLPGTSPTISGTFTPTARAQTTRQVSINLTRSARQTLKALTAISSPTETPTPAMRLFTEKTAAKAQSSKPTATPTPTFSLAAQFPKIERVIIPAPALTTNLLGEETERGLLIYLPASYYQPEKRYPVVYYLLDYGLEMPDVNILPEDIQQDVASDRAREMIVVFVSGTNSLGSSFYVDSPVTGNWDAFVAQDVVRYVDSHYRSIPASTSRGVTGYAVGGFGALSVAMRHPDIFGAVYSISPTLFDDNGLAASPMFSVQRNIDAVLELQVRQLSMTVDEGITAMKHAGDDAQFSVAYGAAFAYNPQGKPPFFDYPYYRQNGRVFRDEAIWQRWQTGFGTLPDKILAHRTALLKLNNITLVCNDNAPYIWILEGCEYFSAQLTKAGVKNTVFKTPGGLEPDFEQGIRTYALPFFSGTLVFDP